MLTVKHFTKTMERQLADDGINKYNSDPDFKISFHDKIEQKVDVMNWRDR